MTFDPSSSYTGEPAAELWTHGSPAVQSELIAAALAVGARAAGPGEFTYRAVRNGRIDLARANRRTLEALIRAGCMDGLGPNRATLMHHLPLALQMGEQNTRAAEAGQVDLFGLAPPTDAGPAAPPAVAMEEVPEWSESVRLQGERETLGLFLTGHPIAEYEQELRHLVSGRIADVAAGKPIGETPRFGGAGR